MTITFIANSTRPEDVDMILQGLDDLADAGVRADHPKLKPARKIAARLSALREDAAARRGHDLGELIDQAARRYLSGDLPAAEITSEALRIDSIINDSGTASRVLNLAQRIIDNEAAAACREIGDVWITEILRPAVTRIIDGLQPQTIEDAWAALHLPRYELDEDHERRAALEQIDAAIAALDDLADLALYWRNCGWVPTLARSEGWQAEDFRWLHHDKLGAMTTDYRAFWLLAVRNGAQPGIWTTAEILQSQPVKASARRTASKEPQELVFAAAGL